MPVLHDSFEYDVGLQYTTEDKDRARSLQKNLRDAGLRVLDWRESEINLWGLPLHDILLDVVTKKCRAVVVLLSENFTNSPSARTELALLLEHRKSVATAPLILPIRLDRFPVPKDLADLLWLDANERTDYELATFVKQAIHRQSENLRADLGSLTERQLAERVRNNRDRGAFEVLLERLYPKIIEAISRIGMADTVAAAVISDFTLQLWRNPPPETAFDEQLRDDFIRFLIFFCAGRIASSPQKKRITLFEQPAAPLASTIAQDTADRQRIRQLLEKLTKAEQEIISFYFTKGMTIKSIAITQGHSEAFVRSELHRILQHLRNQIVHTADESNANAKFTA